MPPPRSSNAAPTPLHSAAEPPPRRVHPAPTWPATAGCGGWPGGVCCCGPGGAGLWRAGWGRAGWDTGGPGGRGVVQMFVQPERVFVWLSKERAPKAGRMGDLEKSCSGLEKSCHDMEKSGKMLEKKNAIMALRHSCYVYYCYDCSNCYNCQR